MDESDSDAAGWLASVLNMPLPLADGLSSTVNGIEYVVQQGIPRQRDLITTATQEQTASSFGFKWHRRESFGSKESTDFLRQWLVARYGDVASSDWLWDTSENPVMLDAGCGAAMSALELFGPALAKIRYVGIDVSNAVDVALERMTERGYTGAFAQCDLMAPPFPDESVDLIFSEGVLHHTDSTEAALKRLSRLLKPGGRFMFYVYRKKGPIREFTDDFIRAELSELDNEEAWARLMPLTKLGEALGKLDVEVEVPEDVELLGIPAGKIPIQRLFYWHVFKAFYRPEMTLEEMNHINFDWYMPSNSHRQTEEEVTKWCAEEGLDIERMNVEEAGITVIARKT